MTIIFLKNESFGICILLKEIKMWTGQIRQEQGNDLHASDSIWSLNHKHCWVQWERVWSTSVDALVVPSTTDSSQHRILRSLYWPSWPGWPRLPRVALGPLSITWQYPPKITNIGHWQCHECGLHWKHNMKHKPEDASYSHPWQDINKKKSISKYWYF